MLISQSRLMELLVLQQSQQRPTQLHLLTSQLHSTQRQQRQLQLQLQLQFLELVQMVLLWQFLQLMQMEQLGQELPTS